MEKGQRVVTNSFFKPLLSQVIVEHSFEPKGLSIAPKTLANFLERKTQLYTPLGHEY